MRSTSSRILLILSALAGPFAAADDVLIKTRDGATLSATLVLPDPRPAGRIPTIMVFDIYTNPEAHKAQAREFAARGYAGVVADARGKRLSPDKIVPYEVEAKDTHAVLDWIVKQPWSDGKVGMIGGSYRASPPGLRPSADTPRSKASQCRPPPSPVWGCRCTTTCS